MPAARRLPASACARNDSRWRSGRCSDIATGVPVTDNAPGPCPGVRTSGGRFTVSEDRELIAQSAREILSVVAPQELPLFGPMRRHYVQEGELPAPSTKGK